MILYRASVNLLVKVLLWSRKKSTKPLTKRYFINIPQQYRKKILKINLCRLGHYSITPWSVDTLEGGQHWEKKESQNDSPVIAIWSSVTQLSMECRFSKLLSKKAILALFFQCGNHMDPLFLLHKESLLFVLRLVDTYIIHSHFYIFIGDDTLVDP